jgi:hypothetical protein
MHGQIRLCYSHILHTNRMSFYRVMQPYHIPLPSFVQLFSSSVFSAADAALDQLLVYRCKQLLKNGSRIKEPLLQLLIFFSVVSIGLSYNIDSAMTKRYRRIGLKYNIMQHKYALTNVTESRKAEHSQQLCIGYIVPHYIRVVIVAGHYSCRTTCNYNVGCMYCALNIICMASRPYIYRAYIKPI